MTEATPEFRKRELTLAPAHRRTPGGRRRNRPCGRLEFFALIGGESGFLTSRGISSYLDIAAQVGIVGTAVTLLLIAGEFDLSIGSMVGFSGMIIALGTTQAHWPLWLSMLAALAFALACGWASACWSCGSEYPVLHRHPCRPLPSADAAIGFSRTIAQQPYIGGVRTRSATIRCNICSRASSSRASTSGLRGRSGWLRSAPSSSQRPSSATGYSLSVGPLRRRGRRACRVARVKIILFMAVSASGVLLAAVQVLSLGSANSFRGQGKEFEAAITAVIGGTSLAGGTGSIVGTAIGALTLGVVRQGLFFRRRRL